MQRLGVRELRRELSRVIRQARAGERIVITVDGVPAAEIGPISVDRKMTIDDLIDAGLATPPRDPSPPGPPPDPAEPRPGMTSGDVLREMREG